MLSREPVGKVELNEVIGEGSVDLKLLYTDLYTVRDILAVWKLGGFEEVARLPSNIRRYFGDIDNKD